MATTQTGPTIDYSMFQTALMRAIRELDDPSGQDVKRHLEGAYPGEINAGRLYHNLGELLEKELIMKGEIDNRTNWYRLTKIGRREYDALVDWMEDAR